MSREKRQKKVSHTWIVWICLANASHAVVVRRRFYLFRTLFCTLVSVFCTLPLPPLLLLSAASFRFNSNWNSFDRWMKWAEPAHTQMQCCGYCAQQIRIRMRGLFDDLVVFLSLFSFRLFADLVILGRTLNAAQKKDSHYCDVFRLDDEPLLSISVSSRT